ncbi:MAG: ABC transporter permease [Terriglobia bacterium]
MFWRLVRRSFWQSQRRTRVALAALTLAATLTAALLNLYFDARGKLGAEFRRYGANLLVTPAATPTGGDLLDETLVQALAAAAPGRVSQALPYLYAVTQLEGQSVVLAGTWLDQATDLRATAELRGRWIDNRRDVTHCLVGAAVATHFGLTPGSRLEVDYRGRQRQLQVAGVLRTGGQEDSQILVNLLVAQELAEAPDKASVLLVRAEGQPGELGALARELTARFPGITVKPLREIAESEVRVLARIRGMLWATTAVVLLLAALSVLATMMGLAAERRREIGLIKALGGSGRQISQLFLVEAALGALAAGVVGASVGIGVSRWLGQQIFASAVQLRWMTFPAAVGIALVVALAGTLLALRLAGRAEPAAILREE